MTGCLSEAAQCLCLFSYIGSRIQVCWQVSRRISRHSVPHSKIVTAPRYERTILQASVVRCRQEAAIEQKFTLNEVASRKGKVMSDRSSPASLSSSLVEDNQYRSRCRLARMSAQGGMGIDGILFINIVLTGSYGRDEWHEIWAKLRTISMAVPPTPSGLDRSAPAEIH